MDELQYKLLDKVNVSERLGRFGNIIPVLILIVTAVISVMVVREYYNDAAELRKRLLIENQLKMASTLDHVEEFLSSIYYDLLFISLDPDVKAMNRKSYPHIKALIDHEWETNKLSEVYVIRRDFDGTHRPFMTFEFIKKDNKKIDAVHSLSYEKEEYEIQVEQIRRFVANPGLRSQISSEITLCMEKEQGNINSRERGFVYSVPVLSGKDLVGMIAAMVPADRIVEELGQGHGKSMAALISNRGDIYGCNNMNAEAIARLGEVFKKKDPKAFSDEAPGVMREGKKTMIWSPVDIHSQKRWWLVYQYEEDIYPASGLFSGFMRGWGSASIILFAGIFLALLVHIMRKRLEERVQFMDERRRAEEALKTLVESMVEVTGQECLDKITHELCGWFDADCAIIGEIVGGNKVKALSMELDGDRVDEYEYELEGTPCENVAEKGPCLFSQGIVDLFPDDQKLVDMKAEGYVGTPISDLKGTTIGVLCAISRRPLGEPGQWQDIMAIIAARAASEIKRSRAEEELRKERDKAQKYLDIAGAIIVAINNRGEVSLINQKGCEVLGYREEEIVGKNWFDLCLPERIRDEVKSVSKRLLAGDIKPLEYYENPVLTKSGEEKIIEWHNAALRDDAGNIIGHLSSGEDITERKQAEDRQMMAARVLELLNRSSEQIDIIRDILVLIKEFTGVDAVGLRLREGHDFPYWETKGFSPEFVEAERFLCARDSKGEIILDSDGNPVLECMCGNVIRGRTDPSQTFFTEGGSFWTNSTTRLLASTSEKDRQSPTRNKCNIDGYESVALIPLNSDKEVIGLLQLNDRRNNIFSLDLINFFEGIGASIGIALERKRAQEALFEEQAETSRFKTLLENVMNNMMTGVLVTDNYGKIIIINRVGQQILGVAEEDGINKSIDELSPDLAIFRELILPTKIGQEISVTLQDGKEIPLGFTSTYLKNPDGREKGVITIFKDLTEVKEIQSQLREREKLATIGELARGIAHEIKNPLFSISASLQTLERDIRYGKLDLETEDGSEQLLFSILYKESERINRLVDSLSFYGKEQEMTIEVIDLIDLLEFILAANSGPINEKNLKIIKSFSSRKIMVEADRDKLLQVFENIVLNAIMFSPPKGAMSVSANMFSDGSLCKIEIGDDGPGIPEENIEKVFEPFFSTRRGGSGFGMAISKRIMDMHGGTIIAQNTKGRGALITIEIPKHSVET